MKDYYNTIVEKTTISAKTILEIGSRDGNDAAKLMDYFQTLELGLNTKEKDIKSYEQR